MTVLSVPLYLDVERLRKVLKDHSFVTQVYYRAQLSSTNDLAKFHAGKGAPEGVLVVTDEQTAGRGRLGRSWWAPPGAALLTSLLFRPALAAERMQQLTMLCALAAADAITRVTGLTVDLKWPNDLLIGGRKVAGLLSEAGFKGGEPDFVVVGMGLNVDVDFSAMSPLMAPATSLQLETGRYVDRVTLLTDYVDQVARRYRRLQAGASPYQEWAARLITIGQSVTAQQGEQALTGTVTGVNAEGALLLGTPDGQTHRLLAADVTLRKASADLDNPERRDRI
jgi:BirA family biotin operon repressor/biotin-[acetyl-CoA-carboxylase] ligase